MLLTAFLANVSSDAINGQPRNGQPRIGVAFGGGSARGLAHVGVIRWLEERRIPIHLVAGTSMGGLIGGGLAAGMSSGELTQLLDATDWDEMFGSSSFRFKNVRRKQDARAYPSRIEFGLKHGISAPAALNNGQHVDFLLSRIAGVYGELPSFDDLPTPFRCVAVDLVTAQQVVLDRGSLVTAMRATMSLPAIFPPVEDGGRVLVDGGALNNVPVDVVRAMGADVVIAVNVGDMRDTRNVSLSILGLVGSTVDVMMLVNTRASLQKADIVINPGLAGFGSLDWRRSTALAEEGYRAAEAMKERLLPFALDETRWAAYQAERRARRRQVLPTPEFVSIAGAVESDRRRMEEVLRARIGQPLDLESLEADLAAFVGLDRYETVGWRLVERDGQHGLRIEARPKPHAPPFLMIGTSLQNTTTSEFTFQLAGRYLAFDTFGSGSELRLDAAVGALPRIGAELYRPIGDSPFFWSAYTGANRATSNFVEDGFTVAQYEQERFLVGADVGINLGRESEVRAGVSVGRLSTTIAAGGPGLPERHGRETRARLRWIYDSQDSPVVPQRGVLGTATITHVFEAPRPDGDLVELVGERTTNGVTQAELEVSVFGSPLRPDRLFLIAGLGTSFGRAPLPPEQFQLGAPMRLGAFDIGEIRGDHYALATVGYLRRVTRLPDFIGGPVFLGGWIENGSAFNDLGDADLHTNVSAGLVLDTLVGPMVVGASFGAKQGRYYVGLGRLF